MISVPLTVLRQSAAELLALVVIDLFPGALLVQNIPTEFGFYCDVIASQPIDDYALPLLEERMRGLAKQDLEVRSMEMMREVAANYLEHKGQPIRADFVKDATENIVSLMQIGEFCDYCPLPYIAQTKEVEFFKLFRVEDTVHYLPEEGFVDVKRIHGTVSIDKPSLKKLVKSIQAGKKADHTKFSGENCFIFDTQISDESWIWEGNGLKIKDLLAHWWKSAHEHQGFSLVATPFLVKETLIKKTEATDQDTVKTEIDGIPYVCIATPVYAHMNLFSAKQRYLKDLPIRYAECAPVVVQPKASVLWGMLNSRMVSADFAHIFCAPQHLEEELISSLQFIDEMIKMFGLEYYWYFKGRGQKYAGTANRWEKAVNSFNSAFQKCGFTYDSYEQEGEGVFAGPVAEARLIDRFGREWKGPSVSLDFNAPDRQSLRYQGADGKPHAPLLIVRSMFGSLERFIALLMEHYSGSLGSMVTGPQVPQKMMMVETFLKLVREKVTSQ